ncbi:MAG: glycoside hydrolase family 3 C-terminal domain-containing protein [Pseudomonadota bacterium]|nr:glycoside hydrolase family 3 C-terminal domain-containing protein [Pseudomonadota bacterium]
MQGARRILACLALLASCLAGGAAPQPLWLDANRSFESRAADLVSRMTLEEKVAQMQNAAPAIPRLGIPAYDWWNEALHGVARAGEATVFPQAIGLAATFDVDLMGKVATVISDEARAKHHEFLRQDKHARYQGLTFWSPNINIFRDPRWGRGQETYGEDPFLTARLGVAFVRGLQGEDRRYSKLDATAKHFAVHSGPESSRHEFDARPTERDLHETYLPAFEALVKEGGVHAVMAAYNRVNGESATASPRLLADILRGEWGFRGYVVSDCDSVGDIHRTHHINDSAEAASALALKSGNDLNCGRTYAALVKAVQDGLATERDVDVALTRLMTARMRLGMFDPPRRVPWAKTPYAVNQAPAHDDLARQAARQSLVLLKNDGLLPLSKAVRRIAVIGPTADSVNALLGNYNGTPAAPVTILQGIRAAVPQAEVIYERGAELVEGLVERPVAGAPGAVPGDAPAPAAAVPAPSAEAALEAARRSDVVVFVGGLTSQIEGEEMRVDLPGFAGGDRTDLRLPASQQQLLEALHATGKPVVLVLTAGSALAVDWAQQYLPAILFAWYPGQRGGSAVADVLFGEADPGGRLPVTFYSEGTSLPAFDDYHMEGRTYRYFRGTPLYPFGHGLSYTQFAWSNLSLSRARLGRNGRLRVTARVRNTGTRTGDVVVQLYLRAEDAPHARANKELRGIRRLTLRPGEQRRVSFDISPAVDLRYYDEASGQYAVDQGKYEVQLGASSADVRLARSFEVR